MTTGHSNLYSLLKIGRIFKVSNRTISNKIYSKFNWILIIEWSSEIVKGLSKIYQRLPVLFKLSSKATKIYKSTTYNSKPSILNRNIITFSPIFKDLSG